MAATTLRQRYTIRTTLGQTVQVSADKVTFEHHHVVFWRQEVEALVPFYAMRAGEVNEMLTEGYTELIEFV